MISSEKWKSQFSYRFEYRIKGRTFLQEGIDPDTMKVMLKQLKIQLKKIISISFLHFGSYNTDEQIRHKPHHIESINFYFEF